MKAHWRSLVLAWLLCLSHILAANAAGPVVQIVSATKDSVTVTVTSGEVTQTATLNVGQTATVANQSVTLAYVAGDKAVLSINGVATTLSAGTTALAAGGLLTITPTALTATALAAGLAATSQGGSTSTHSTATHH